MRAQAPPGRHLYWHAATRTSTWEHPNDAKFKEKVHVARAQRRLVVITLTWKNRDAEDSTVVATTIGGTEVAAVASTASDSFDELEDALRKSIILEHGAVLCFAQPDASLIGFSARAKRVEEVLN